jgi:hypothetical protein
MAETGDRVTDFRKLAASLNPAIPADDVDKIVPVLEALEKSFAPLRASIPTGANVWTGPEDFE